jgi:zinc/manganese transport system ATP-binding protein
MSAAVELHDLTVAYHGHPAIHHISGRFPSGSLTAIVGPNGAGKSTLLSAIVGLGRLTQGRITRRHDLRGPGAVALLAQLSGMNPDFPLRVLEVAAMGAWARVGPFGALDRHEHNVISQALQQVGLEGFEDRLVDELSVGQLQRVLFARLIVQDAPIILLDEPFSALDAATTHDLLAVTEKWHRAGRTVIAVLHDLDMVREHFEQTLLIARELVAWGPTQEVLTPAYLQQANQRSLAWQDSASWCEVPVRGHSHQHTHEAH